MKQIIIVGARGWGREVYHAISNTPEVKNGELKIKGFLDSDSDALTGLRGTFPPILGAPDDYIPQEDELFFIALGDSHWRKHYAEMMEEKGARFYTYISSNAVVYDNAFIGEGSYIAGWSSVSDNVSLGKHTIVHSFTSLGHDAKVGDYSTLLSYVFLGGYVEVGKCSTMNPKSMIIPHKKIGDNVSVGAASVVIRNVKDNLHVHGNPAVKINI